MVCTTFCKGCGLHHCQCNLRAFPDLPYYEFLHCPSCMERLPIERYECSMCKAIVAAYKDREVKLGRVVPEDIDA